jgi:hypothetical protein
MAEPVELTAGFMHLSVYCEAVSRGISMTLGTILIIILILILLGAIPAWPYSTGWGYGPSGIVGVLLVVLLILVLMGRV